MYLVWYILLNIIIFGIFIFPVLYNLTLLNFKDYYRSSYVSNNKFLSKNYQVSFKNLYNEYEYFNNLQKCNLSKYLVNIKLVLKSLNLSLSNYNPYFNYLNISNNIVVNNVDKLNLNYYSNANFKNFFFKSISLKKLNSYNNYKIYSSVNLDSLSNIALKGNFYNRIKSKWVTKYSPSNFIKYITDSNLLNYNILYLRKNKVFNKGRYSRNRQYYRTGVYWCLYVNIIAVVGIYFWFYRFTMNFGYLWWLLYLFIVSFILPKTIKFRLYNLNILFNTYILNFIWLSNMVKNFFGFFLNIYKFLLKFLYNLNVSFLYNLNKSFIFSFFSFFLNFFKNFDYLNFNYLSYFEYNYINKYVKIK